MSVSKRGLILAATTALWAASASIPTRAAPPPGQPWLNRVLPPDLRADLLMRALTPAQANGFLFATVEGSLAGVVSGVPALGIPDVTESDASIGVRNGNEHTALPSSLTLAASFDPDVAAASGAMVGFEAHQDGVSQLFGPGGDLVRDPRGGRTFEYVGEDPFLGGTILAAYIRGLQSQTVLATIKHYALNDEESDRQSYNVVIGDRAARESDLLLFELAIEQGRPGAVMTALNKVGGFYAADNSDLLTNVLKNDWKFKGLALTDFGQVSDPTWANAGLDQQSGIGLFTNEFGPALQQAVADGRVPPQRYEDAVHRVLRTYFASGVIDNPPVAGTFDATSDALVSQRAAERGMVLLKNGTAGAPELPLSKTVGSIAVIGSHADVGVLEGGGSAAVLPIGGNAVPDGTPVEAPYIAAPIWDKSPPLAAIAAEAPGASVTFNSGADPQSAAALAARSSVAIVFVNQPSSEGLDLAGLSLPADRDSGVDQNALVAAVAAANPNTIVVAETSSAFAMPWLENVAGVLAAWYPGQNGGKAIARVLFGDVNPSGHLPITFPQDVSQLPRPVIPAFNAGGFLGEGPAVDVDYNIEGQNVGYKWFDVSNQKPLFPFGFGLSYTTFAYNGLTPKLVASPSGTAVAAPFTVGADVTVTNSGPVAGAATPQLYVGVPGGRGEAPKRLGGFARVELRPGEHRTVTIKIDPRLFAEYEPGRHDWHVVGGAYRLSVGADEASTSLSSWVQLPDLRFPATHLF